jgi:hypothetical protein
MAELLDELSLAARIEGGRYEPLRREIDTLELAEAARERLGDDRVRVSGAGEVLETDAEAVDRGVSALVQAALRHGGLDEVEVAVSGRELRVSPISESSGRVVLGEELRDLGAAVAVLVIEELGGSTAVEDGTLIVRLA